MASKSKSRAASKSKASAKSSSKKSSKSQQAQARAASEAPGQRHAATIVHKVGDPVTVNLERIPQAEFNDDHKFAFNKGFHGRQGVISKLEGGKAFVEGDTMTANVPVDVLDAGHLDLLGHGRARKSSRKKASTRSGKKGKAAGEVRVASQSKDADVAPAGRG
jgi:hypothetical protein